MAKRRTKRAQERKEKRASHEKGELVKRTQVSMPVDEAVLRLSRDVDATEVKLRGLFKERKELQRIATRARASARMPDHVDAKVRTPFRGKETLILDALSRVATDIQAAGVDLRRLKASRDKLDSKKASQPADEGEL